MKKNIIFSYDPEKKTGIVINNLIVSRIRDSFEKKKKKKRKEKRTERRTRHDSLLPV